jgi:hypothetical protein
MTDELFEYINTRYRAAPYRILFGGSNAGWFVVYALLENRRAFSAYLILRKNRLPGGNPPFRSIPRNCREILPVVF